MKINVNRKDMLDVLKDIKKINTGTNNIIPILENIKVTTAGEIVTVSYSDIEISIIKTLEATIVETGSALFPLKKLDAYLRKLKDDFITLDGDALQAGSKKFSFKVPPSENYPKFPKVKNDGFRIYKNEFVELFKNVTYAVGKQESRPVLTAVQTIVTDSDITANACDSHRMTQKKLTIDTGESFQALIPGKAIDKVLKMDMDDVFQFINNDSNVCFKGKNTTVIIKKVEGTYPGLERLKLQAVNATIELDRLEFLESLELAKMVIKDRNNTVVKLTSDGTATLSTDDRTREFSDTFNNELESKHDGETMTIYFNPDYAIETLKNIDSEKVTFSYNASIRPFTITGDDGGYHLITPVRMY